MAAPLTPHLVVVGGGFAGLWATAAACARRNVTLGDDLHVTLISAKPDLTIRPRLYETDPQATLVPLEPIVTGIGADLRVDTVTGIDADSGTITLDKDVVSCDAMILAAGSTSPMPSISGLADHGHRIDTFEHSVALRRAIEQRATGNTLRVSVIGGGLTGVELAAELASEPGIRVSLVDSGCIGDGFGPEARHAVRDALQGLGVQLLDDRRVRSVETTRSITDSGPVEHDLVVWCGGLRASPLTELVAGTRDALGRLHVDRELRVVGQSTMWAAGDVASTSPDGTHIAPMSCQFALPTGRVAGHNAAAHLMGGHAVPFEMDRYVTCVDLGAAGAVFTTGWERSLLATGADGKAIKRHINRSAIHPPSDPDALLTAAIPDATAPWT